MSLQSFDAVILYQDFHLADGDGIELCQPLGLMPKRIEFDTVKIRVVERFPNTQELNRIPVPQPVLDNVARIVAVLQLGDVSQADKVISLGIPLYTNFRSLDNQLVRSSEPLC